MAAATPISVAIVEPAKRPWWAAFSPLSVDAKARHELDGLRGIAVLLTVVYHLMLYLPRVVTLEPAVGQAIASHASFFALGATGVHLFFVLSGFLLFRPYAVALLEGGALPSARRFLARRALRILPAYWVALVLIVVLFRPEFMEPGRRSDFALHWFMLHDWSAATIESINPAFWTMAVESQFYLLLPVLAWLLHRAAGARGRAALVFPLLLVVAPPVLCALVAKLLPGASPLTGHTTLLYPFGFLLIFGAGAMVSFFHVAYTLGRLSPKFAREMPRYARIAGVVGLVALALHAFVSTVRPAAMNEHRAAYWLFSVPLLAVGYGGLLAGTLHGFPSWRRTFSRPGLRVLGVISYSLYIWNIPLFVHVILPLAARGGSDGWIMVRAFVCAVLVLVPASYLSFMLIERPTFSARFKLR